MGKLIVTEFVSTDGVMEAPQDWHFPSFLANPDAQEEKSQEALQAGGLLFGRTTYDIMAGAWPERGRDMAGEPEPTREEYPETFFEDKFNWMPKWVVSDRITDDEAHWHNSQIIRSGELKERIEAIKAESGDRPIYIQGSGKLIESLLPLGVIDEIHLMVHPVWVGAGQRVFPDGADKVWFELVNVKPLGKDIVQLEYAITDEPEMPAFE